MRKKYIIKRTEFTNVYRLAWLPQGEAIPNGWEVITRADAYRMCREERRRRLEDESFSGFGSAEIFPYEAVEAGTDYRWSYRFSTQDRILYNWA